MTAKSMQKTSYILKLMISMIVKFALFSRPSLIFEKSTYTADFCLELMKMMRWSNWSSFNLKTWQKQIPVFDLFSTKKVIIAQETESKSIAGGFSASTLTFSPFFQFYWLKSGASDKNVQFFSSLVWSYVHPCSVVFWIWELVIATQI